MGPHMVPYLRAANVMDGMLDLADVKEMNFEPKEQSVFALRKGDVLVTEGSGSLRAVGASSVWEGEIPGVVCFQNTLLRLRPRPSTDPRFLAWWCRFAFADGLFASVATGANIFHVSADRVRGLPMTYLALGHQRAIADFLDTETARIDAVIAKKRRLIELLNARCEEAVTRVLLRGDGDMIRSKPTDVPLVGEVPPGWSVVPLGSLLGYISYGFTNPMPTEDDGPFMLTANDIQDGSIRFDTARRTSLAAYNSLLTNKSRPRRGDILLTKDGTLGRVAVFDGDRSCINQSVALLRLSRDGPPPRLVAELLRARPYRDAVLFDAGGTTIKHLYVSRVPKLRLAVPPRSQWGAVLSKVEEVRALHAEAGAKTAEQLDLLVEHRQALITAAVTGELSVPGIAA